MQGVECFWPCQCVWHVLLFFDPFLPSLIQYGAFYQELSVFTLFFLLNPWWPILFSLTMFYQFISILTHVNQFSSILQTLKNVISSILTRIDQCQTTFDKYLPILNILNFYLLIFCQFLKKYEQVKPDLFQNFYSFPILFLIQEFIMFSKPKWNTFFYLYFLGFAKTNHENINIINLCEVWLVSERRNILNKWWKYTW